MVKVLMNPSRNKVGETCPHANERQGVPKKANEITNGEIRI
jgi:hypothetical protein